MIKKRVLGIAALVLVAAGWAHAQGMPDFVNMAIKNAPSDALVGVGSANTGNAGLKQARTAATAGAWDEIARLFSMTVIEHINDGGDTEIITPDLSNLMQTGSYILKEGKDGNNNYWVVVAIDWYEVALEANKGRVNKVNEKMDKAFEEMDKAIEKMAREPVGSR